MSNRGCKLSYGLPPDITRLLYNNDPPVDHQIAEMQSSLKIARSLKSELSAQLTELRMNLMRLEREEMHAARHIERCEIALAPIRRIPTETLLQIFLAYADLLGAKPDCLDMRGGIWLLSHICRYWRALAISTHELWTAIAFACSRSRRRDAPALVRMWLDRTKNRPLAIRFYCDAPGTHDHAHMHRGRGVQNICRSIFQYFVHRRSQWNEAELGLSYHLIQSMNTTRGNFGRLEKLTLRSMDPHRLSIVGAPRLQNVTLINEGNPGAEVVLPWLRINTYEGPLFPNFRSHIFSNAPNIEHCTISSIPSPDSHQLHLQPAVVHHLRHLHLSDASMIPSFLTLPALQGLRFRARDAASSLMSLKRLLQRSMATPTSLHIDNFVFSEELLDFLWEAPTATTLTIHCDTPSIPDAEALFTYFEQTAPGVDVILPALRQLSMQGLAFGEITVRMLEMRCRLPSSSPSSVDVARLQRLDLADVSNTHASHILRIRKLQADAGLQLEAEAVYAVRILPDM